jgi:hypothetical protein
LLQSKIATHAPLKGRGMFAAALVALAGLVPCALAGGSPENTLIIINPGSNESMFLGNYYKNARGTSATRARR